MWRLLVKFENAPLTILMMLILDIARKILRGLYPTYLLRKTVFSEKELQIGTLTICSYSPLSSIKRTFIRDWISLKLKPLDRP